jgi:predicted metal-dependent enzyme (double-stranded beta helix superfamily)
VAEATISRVSWDIDRFVAACKAVRFELDAPQRIADLLRDVIADPVAIASAVDRRRAGERAGEMAEIFLSYEDLTIYQLAFPSNLFGVPHDHGGWAVIGVYSGIEAFNVYEERDGELRRIGRRELIAPAVDILPADLIHDIDNPSDTVSGSIHVYSNRHFDMASRRIWRDAASRAEPFTLARSFEYGMARTAERRREMGMPEAQVQAPPDLERVRKSS